MTGRALYDRVTDAMMSQTGEWDRRNGTVGQIDCPPRAWSFLASAERKVWNKTAEALTVRKPVRR